MKRFMVLLLALPAWGYPAEITLQAPDKSVITVKAPVISRDETGAVYAQGRIEVTHNALVIKCIGTATARCPGGAFASLETEGNVEATGFVPKAEIFVNKGAAHAKKERGRKKRFGLF
ncbi:MAG: hypothetical protein NT045_07415 [Candidatus Aureabacteria bacterium]|nr:hypothetical protein [Candidatus Auribacterota bacterium]